MVLVVTLWQKLQLGPTEETLCWVFYAYAYLIVVIMCVCVFVYLSFFWMVNISQNMECESNPCFNWNWDIDASSSLLNQVYSYLKEVDNKFFQNGLFVPLLYPFLSKNSKAKLPTYGTLWHVQHGYQMVIQACQVSLLIALGLALNHISLFIC